MNEKKTKLTARQDKAYRFIVSLIEEELRPPSLQELADYLGISKSSAVQRIDACVQKGWIRRSTNNRTYVPVGFKARLIPTKKEKLKEENL